MAQKSSFIPNLDLLRAVAVLFVLVDHTLDAMAIVPPQWESTLNWLGRAGVLFFFVHTCCVLMMSLERHRGKHLFRNFYLRRLFRIYPLSIVAVLLAMLLPHQPQLTRMEWLSNLTLTQNLTFSKEAFGSIWSLPLEVQMYLFLPFIFLIVRVRHGFLFTLALTAISYPMAFWLPHHIGRASVFSFVPAFLPGVIAYWIFRNRKPILPAWMFPPTLAVVTACLLLHPNWQFSAWFTCLALGFLLPQFRQLTSRPLNVIAFELAKYSYGIYLSHTLILMCFHPTWRTLPVYLVAVAVASVAGYHFIEYPMILLGQRLTREKSTMVQRESVPA